MQKRTSRFVILAIVVIGILAAVNWRWNVANPPQASHFHEHLLGNHDHDEHEHEAEQPEPPELPTELIPPNGELGDKSAKVVVLWTYPSGCGHCAEAYQLLVALTEAYQGKVRATFANSESEEAKPLGKEGGFSGAGLAINGKTKLKIKESGKVREVTFTGLVGSEWTKQDLILAVHEEVSKVYGPMPMPEVKPPGEEPPDAEPGHIEAHTEEHHH